MAKKKPYRFVLYLMARAVAGMFYLLPRSVALSLARGMGRLGFLMVWRHRRKTLAHLKIAYAGTKSDAEINAIAAQVFENLLETGAEFLQFPKLDREKVARFVDLGNAVEIYRELLSEGKGVISMTAHLGNWELLAALMPLNGFEGAVLGRRIYYEPYNRWVVGNRMALGVKTIYRDDSAKEIYELLKANKIVGLLPDQDISSLKGVFVPFFGRPAHTAVAPVRIALSTGAPMITNFLVREPGNRYKIVIGEIIRPRVEASLSGRQGSREESIYKYTAQWMASFEKIIRQYPGQWAWMHNRWKTVEKK